VYKFDSNNNIGIQYLFYLPHLDKFKWLHCNGLKVNIVLALMRLYFLGKWWHTIRIWIGWLL